VDLLDRLTEDPAHAGLFLDVDGVLAPIVPRPEDARVPEQTRVELRRLAARYALVACISGRAGHTAAEIVGVPELTYVGNHGLELEPTAQEWAVRLQDFLAGVAWPELENKRLTASLHFRNVRDEGGARQELDAIAARARSAGLLPRYGRKVLELLPPLEASKGTAVRQLVAEGGLERALYAGDDTTDLDGFAALDGLGFAVRVAVASPEGPPALRANADVILQSQDDVLPLLGRL
jgi:trehalose 6-phosphate phosphatase